MKYFLSIFIVVLYLVFFLCFLSFGETPKLRLRSTPATIVSKEEMVPWIREYGFNHPGIIFIGEEVINGIEGKLQHEYELKTLQGEKVLCDHATGLIWQQSGSIECMNWEASKNYVAQLNASQYAGFSDWRLPTLEELVSLLEFTQKSKDFYIDPIFDIQGTSYCYWSADLKVSGDAWVVSFSSGFVYDGYANHYEGYVRAVRSKQ